MSKISSYRPTYSTASPSPKDMNELNEQLKETEEGSPRIHPIGSSSETLKNDSTNIPRVQKFPDRWKPAITRAIWFLHGAVFVALLVLGLRWHHANALIDGVIASVDVSGMSEQQRAKALMLHVHEIMLPRTVLLVSKDKFFRSRFGPIDNFLFDTADHLNTAIGSCGSFAGVTARVLRRAGYDARITQMLCGEVACHIILEVKLDGSWAVMDPFFALTFTRPDGKLASAYDVSQNWIWYKTQVPERSGVLHYPYDRFNYEGLRYTNWGKVPILMPLLKSVLRVILGDRVDTLSIRTYVLNQNATFFWILLVSYSIACALAVLFRRHGVGEVTPNDEGSKAAARIRKDIGPSL
jgi:hypothetical protein